MADDVEQVRGAVMSGITGDKSFHNRRRRRKLARRRLMRAIRAEKAKGKEAGKERKATAGHSPA